MPDAIKYTHALILCDVKIIMIIYVEEVWLWASTIKLSFFNTMGDTLSTLSESPATSEHSLPRGKPLVRMQKKTKTVRPVSNVAAIDFGTTYCSLAYITEGDQEPTMMNFEYTYPRVPTSLLLKRNDDDGTVNVKCFGYEARREYTRIRPKSQHQYIYFDRVKMNLKEEENTEVLLYYTVVSMNDHISR